MRGLGTLLNLITVACGGIAGVLIGARLPERARRTIMQGLGLVTVAVAIVGLEPLGHADLGLRRFVIMIVAVIAGAIAGEALRLEDRLEQAGEALRARVVPPPERSAGRSRQETGDHSRFVDGFVVASTVFCVGPLTVLGAIEDGLGRSVRLLAIKSSLDGIAAAGFGSVYGWGVLGSLLTIAILQGTLTAAATLIAPVMTPEVLAELEAVGSLLVLGIGLRLLDVAHIRVVNLLPAIVIAPLLAGGVESIL
jgi:uncharacterized membrane protein YqgA involved in biofilm formation